MRSPSSSSSAAFLRGTLRKISAMIMNGKTPTLISGVPNVAFSLAITRSHASASPSAPARQCPRAAHSTGLPSSPMSVNSAGNFVVVSRCLWISGTSAANPARLPPELNVVSWVHARTTQRTASSSRARVPNAARRSSSTSSESALRVSGWSSAMVATPPATS